VTDRLNPLARFAHWRFGWLAATGVAVTILATAWALNDWEHEQIAKARCTPGGTCFGFTEFEYIDLAFGDGLMLNAVIMPIACLIYLGATIVRAKLDVTPPAALALFPIAYLVSTILPWTIYYLLYLGEMVPTHTIWGSDTPNAAAAYTFYLAFCFLLPVIIGKTIFPNRNERFSDR
jgi:hypothetical protein